MLSPRSDPRPALEVLCVRSGDGTHRDSLPGLCRGQWDLARSGESSFRHPTSAPTQPWAAGGNNAWVDGDQSGRGPGVAAGEMEGEEHP